MSRLLFARAYVEGDWQPEEWPVPTRSREEWVVALDASAARVRDRLAGTPAAWLQREVPMLDGRPSRGWRLLILMVEHDVAHRSQVQAYAGLYGWGVSHIFGRSAADAGLDVPPTPG